MNNETYKLTYFTIRGAAEPIRLIFALSGIEYTDERITFDETWPEKKPTFPWGALPVLEVQNSATGDTLRLAQTAAITRFLAKKFGFLGQTDAECAKCDEYVDASKDFLLEFRAWYKAEDETVKSAKLKEIKETHFPFYFSKFEEILAKNGTGWLTGDKPTWADLYVAHDLDNYGSFMVPEWKTMKEYSNVRKHVEKVYALDGIAQWIKDRPDTVF